MPHRACALAAPTTAGGIQDQRAVGLGQNRVEPAFPSLAAVADALAAERVNRTGQDKVHLGVALQQAFAEQQVAAAGRRGVAPAGIDDTQVVADRLPSDRLKCRSKPGRRSARSVDHVTRENSDRRKPETNVEPSGGFAVEPEDFPRLLSHRGEIPPTPVEKFRGVLVAARGLLGFTQVNQRLGQRGHQPTVAGCRWRRSRLGTTENAAEQSARRLGLTQTGTTDPCNLRGAFPRP